MKYLYCSLLLVPLPLVVLSGCSTPPATATNEISASKISGTPIPETAATATPANAVAQPTAVKFLPPTKVLNAGQASWTFYSTPTTVMVSRATGGQADLNGTVYEGKFVDRFVPLMAEDGLYCVLEIEGEVFLCQSEDDGKTWKKGLTITNGVKLLDASFSRGEKGGSIYISGEATVAETGINVGDKVEVTTIYNPFSKEWRALLKTKVKVDGG